jgi:hypothetical protein
LLQSQPLSLSLVVLMSAFIGHSLAQSGMASPLPGRMSSVDLNPAGVLPSVAPAMFSVDRRLEIGRHVGLIMARSAQSALLLRYCPRRSHTDASGARRSGCALAVLGGPDRSAPLDLPDRIVVLDTYRSIRYTIRARIERHRPYPFILRTLRRSRGSLGHGHGRKSWPNL